MTKDDLVFDWGNSESRLRDRILAAVLVAIFFTFVFGSMNIQLKSAFQTSPRAASLIRFESKELAARWLQIAEEGGPIPGRMEYGGDVLGADPALAFKLGDPSVDTEYDVSLRDFVPGFGVTRLELATKGFRVFPEIPRNEKAPAATVTEGVFGAKQPILTPYDEVAIDWMPAKLPPFVVGEGIDISGSPWRFALALRDDGTIRDCISLGGGDAGLKEISAWLGVVTFGEGEDDRWLGLRVELTNRRIDGSGAE